MSSVTVVGADGVHRMLRAYTNPSLNRRLQDATKAGAMVYKAPLKAAARPLSKRLAKSVSVRKARRERPATVVTFRPKVAWFRHFIIGGTRDHGPRKAPRMLIGLNALRGTGAFGVRISGPGVLRGLRSVTHVRGVKPHPIVAAVVAANATQAYAAINRDLDRTET